ncbi:hypothetical protein SK128_020915, partial [Halocaridina rubra]
MTDISSIFIYVRYRLKFHSRIQHTLQRSKCFILSSRCTKEIKEEKTSSREAYDSDSNSARNWLR